MANGYLVHGKCYASSDDATDAYYSAAPVGITPGVTTYVGHFQKVGANWTFSRFQIASNGSVLMLPSSNLLPLTVPSCDTTEQFTDGVTVGWGIATVMVAAWCYNMVRKQAK